MVPGLAGRHMSGAGAELNSRPVEGLNLVDIVEDDLFLALERVGEELRHKPRPEPLWERREGV